MPESGPLRLKLRDPDGQEREVSFTQDVITIGRSHECDLPLESGFISRNHARLSYMSSGGSEGGGWQIVDQGSKNGVFVNGQRIAGSTAVKPGDALRIGDYRVSVLPAESDAPAAEESDSDRTLVLNPAMLEEINPPAESHAVRENIAPSPTISPAQQAAAPQRQELSSATGAAIPPAMQEPATPPHGVAAPEPVAPVAAETPAAVTPLPEAEADRGAVPAAAQTPEAAGVRSSADTDAPDRSSESGAAAGTERLVVDAAHRSIRIDGRDLTGQLSSREIDVLIALSAAGANGTGIDELANAVWGSGGGDAEMLERLLYRLRGKAGADLVERLPGRGLRLRAAG